MQSILTSRLDDFQQGLQKSQMDISNSQMAKIEENLCDNFTFRRKGNENQYKHEAKVLAKLKEANTHLNDPNVGMPSVNAAKEKISEGIELVQNRQKVIKHHQESSDQRRPGRCYDCGQKGHVTGPRTAGRKTKMPRS